jgi:hypothetical protein
VFADERNEHVQGFGGQKVAQRPEGHS